MGEIADSIVSGECCAFCLQPFIDKNEMLYEHGYPAACSECWEEKCGYQKSIAKTYSELN